MTLGCDSKTDGDTPKLITTGPTNLLLAGIVGFYYTWGEDRG